MHKLYILTALLIWAASSVASGTCFCLKCAFGKYEMFQAVSDSMTPALDTSACSNARKIDAVNESLTAGDVIVFRHPKSEDPYVFRIVALSGDTVQLNDGVLWINGTAVQLASQSDYETVFQKNEMSQAFPRCSTPPKLGNLAWPSVSLKRYQTAENTTFSIREIPSTTIPLCMRSRTDIYSYSATIATIPQTVGYLWKGLA